MKKINLFVIILLCIMASCQKRAFTCECPDANGNVTRSFVVHASTIQSADADCEAGQLSGETCTGS